MVRAPVLSLCMLSFWILSCGSDIPEKHYYSMSYPLPIVENIPGAGYKYDNVLRIKKFDVSMAYDRPQIVYRYSPYKLKYYNYQLWIGRPQKILRNMVFRHLYSVHMFKVVTKELSQVPDYELKAEIEGIEEYDSGDVWYAHLAMNFKLIDFKDKQVLWVYSFDRREKVFNQKPVYVVKVLSNIMKEEMDGVIHQLDVFLSEQSGVQPGLPWLDGPKDEKESPDNPWGDPWETLQ